MDDPGKRAAVHRSEAAPSLRDATSPCRSLRGRSGNPETDPSDLSLSRIVQERDQLRLILQMVLDMRVYDGAGRPTTVQSALRGHLATRVRMALDGKRTT